MGDENERYIHNSRWRGRLEEKPYPEPVIKVDQQVYDPSWVDKLYNYFANLPINPEDWNKMEARNKSIDEANKEGLIKRNLPGLSSITPPAPIGENLNMDELKFYLRTGTLTKMGDKIYELDKSGQPYKVPIGKIDSKGNYKKYDYSSPWGNLNIGTALPIYTPPESLQESYTRNRDIAGDPSFWGSALKLYDANYLPNIPRWVQNLTNRENVSENPENLRMGYDPTGRMVGNLAGGVTQAMIPTPFGKGQLMKSTLGVLPFALKDASEGEYNKALSWVPSAIGGGLGGTLIRGGKYLPGIGMIAATGAIPSAVSTISDANASGEKPDWLSNYLTTAGIIAAPAILPWLGGKIRNFYREPKPLDLGDFANTKEVFPAKVNEPLPVKPPEEQNVLFGNTEQAPPTFNPNVPEPIIAKPKQTPAIKIEKIVTPGEQGETVTKKFDYKFNEIPTEPYTYKRYRGIANRFGEEIAVPKQVKIPNKDGKMVSTYTQSPVNKYMAAVGDNNESAIKFMANNKTLVGKDGGKTAVKNIDYSNEASANNLINTYEYLTGENPANVKDPAVIFNTVTSIMDGTAEPVANRPLGYFHKIWEKARNSSDPTQNSNPIIENGKYADDVRLAQEMKNSFGEEVLMENFGTANPRKIAAQIHNQHPQKVIDKLNAYYEKNNLSKEIGEKKNQIDEVLNQGYQIPPPVINPIENPLIYREQGLYDALLPNSWRAAMGKTGLYWLSKSLLPDDSDEPGFSWQKAADLAYSASMLYGSRLTNTTGKIISFNPNTYRLQWNFGRTFKDIPINIPRLDNGIFSGVKTGTEAWASSNRPENSIGYLTAPDQAARDLVVKSYNTKLKNYDDLWNNSVKSPLQMAAKDINPNGEMGDFGKIVVAIENSSRMVDEIADKFKSDVLVPWKNYGGANNGFYKDITIRANYKVHRDAVKVENLNRQGAYNSATEYQYNLSKATDKEAVTNAVIESFKDHGKPFTQQEVDMIVNGYYPKWRGLMSELNKTVYDLNIIGSTGVAPDIAVKNYAEAEAKIKSIQDQYIDIGNRIANLKKIYKETGDKETYAQISALKQQINKLKSKDLTDYKRVINLFKNSQSFAKHSEETHYIHTFEDKNNRYGVHVETYDPVSRKKLPPTQYVGRDDNGIIFKNNTSDALYYKTATLRDAGMKKYIADNNLIYDSKTGYYKRNNAGGTTDYLSIKPTDRAQEFCNLRNRKEDIESELKYMLKANNDFVSTFKSYKQKLQALYKDLEKRDVEDMPGVDEDVQGIKSQLDDLDYIEKGLIGGVDKASLINTVRQWLDNMYINSPRRTVAKGYNGWMAEPGQEGASAVGNLLLDLRKATTKAASATAKKHMNDFWFDATAVGLGNHPLVTWADNVSTLAQKNPSQLNQWAQFLGTPLAKSASKIADATGAMLSRAVLSFNAHSYITNMADMLRIYPVLQARLGSGKGDLMVDLVRNLPLGFKNAAKYSKAAWMGRNIYETVRAPFANNIKNNIFRDHLAFYFHNTPVTENMGLLPGRFESGWENINDKLLALTKNIEFQNRSVTDMATVDWLMRNIPQGGMTNAQYAKFIGDKSLLLTQAVNYSANPYLQAPWMSTLAKTPFAKTFLVLAKPGINQIYNYAQLFARDLDNTNIAGVNKAKAVVGILGMATMFGGLQNLPGLKDINTVSEWIKKLADPNGADNIIKENNYDKLMRLGGDMSEKAFGNRDIWYDYIYPLANHGIDAHLMGIETGRDGSILSYSDAITYDYFIKGIYGGLEKIIGEGDAYGGIKKLVPASQAYRIIDGIYQYTIGQYINSKDKSPTGREFGAGDMIKSFFGTDISKSKSTAAKFIQKTPLQDPRQEYEYVKKLVGYPGVNYSTDDSDIKTQAAVEGKIMAIPGIEKSARDLYSKVQGKYLTSKYQDAVGNSMSKLDDWLESKKGFLQAVAKEDIGSLISGGTLSEAYKTYTNQPTMIDYAPSDNMSKLIKSVKQDVINYYKSYIVANELNDLLKKKGISQEVYHDYSRYLGGNSLLKGEDTPISALPFNDQGFEFALTRLLTKGMNVTTQRELQGDTNIIEKSSLSKQKE